VRALVAALLLTPMLPAALDAGAPLAGLAVSAQSEHFVFYATRRSGKPDVARSERFLAEVERTLGHDVSGRADYFLVEHPSDIFAATGLYTDGVTDLEAGAIMSVRGFHPHELVHRVAAELGNPGLFFHEGLAVALGEKGKLGGKDVDRLARRALERRSFEAFLVAFSNQPREEAYAVAGSFVRHLLSRYSARQVAEYFKACGRQGRPCSSAFSRVFGASFDEAVVSWRERIG